MARTGLKKSAFAIGTGNPGMANIMEQMGFKAGLTVLLGDIFKTVAACFLSWFLFMHLGLLAMAYSLLGVVLGHNFPLWNGFRGGKGVTVTCSAMVLLLPGWGIGCCLLGFFAVFFTHYLAVGAIVIPVSFIAPAFLFCGAEVGWIAVIMAVIMFFEHLPGLIRMARGTEDPTDLVAIVKARRGKKSE